MKRSLLLKRETLAALTDGELGAVAGGQAVTTPVTQCSPTTLPIRTLPVNECVAASDAHTCIDCLTRFC